MIPVPGRQAGAPSAPAYIESPICNFGEVSDKDVTMGLVIAVSAAGPAFVVPADSNPIQGCTIWFNEDWLWSNGNTYLVEIVLFASGTEYYTVDSTTLSASAFLADGSNFVGFQNGGGAVVPTGSLLNLRARFTPIGAPNPILNVTVGVSS
jgi:hypothetical protein